MLIGLKMKKNKFYKQDNKQASISVIRAMTRINDHINRQASRSIVWDRRSILHPSITS